MYLPDTWTGSTVLAVEAGDGLHPWLVLQLD